MKKTFVKFDKTKSGKIKPTEISNLLRKAGQNPTNEDCDKILADLEESS